MERSFEEIALDIIKLHIKVQSARNDSNSSYRSYTVETDYDVNSIFSITNSVINTANQLRQNWQQQMLAFDEQRFNRELDRTLRDET